MVGAHWGPFCSVLGDTPEDPEFNCSFNSSSDFYKDPILCFNLHPDYFCFIDYAKAFDCVDHNKLWKIFKEIETSDHLTCLLRNLHAGQEATIRTGHGATDWFQIGKGVRQGCILSPCLFNLYAEYILRNAGLGEAQAGIKIAVRNINNLRHADDTTLMAGSEEEQDYGIWSHHFIENRWGDNGNSDRLYFWGLQNHCRW